jgi:hypothetical protein
MSDISAIIPACNAAPQLGEAIESVRGPVKRPCISRKGVTHGKAQIFIRK